ncbi:MAG: MFS transporter [Bacteroidales bacterium]
MLLFGICMISLGSVAPDLRVKLGLDDVSAGTLFSILPFGILAGSLAFGPLADRNGYKLLLAVSCLVMGGGFTGLAWTGSGTLVKVYVFLIGLGGGAVNGATNGIVSDISSSGKGSKLNLLGVFYGLGALGMPLVLGLLRKTGFEIILTVVGGLAFITGIGYLFIKFPAPKRKEETTMRSDLALLKNDFLLLIATFLFFQSSFEGVLNNWTTTFMINVQGAHKEAALFALSAVVAGMSVMRVLTGTVLKQIPERKMLPVCFAMVATGLLMLSIFKEYSLAVTGLFILGAGFSYGFPVMLGFLGNRFASMSGTAFSIALVISLVGNMSVNYAMGHIVRAFGPESIVTVAALELTAMSVLAAYIMKKI